MIQVGPKEWLVSSMVKQDPRVKTYEAQGHAFFTMPDGFYRDGNISDLFGEDVFLSVPHLDFNLGGIPGKKVVAICPHYRSENRMSTGIMTDKFGVRLVEVPAEEARRHPANFLPLGNGRVLVDQGAPLFIDRLRKAGVDVVPTIVPLDFLIRKKGGLHCLFNELPVSKN